MKRLLKPLRVALALAFFACVNAAFLAPMIAAALCTETPRGFERACGFQLWPALASVNFVALFLILVATSFLGRIYCSVVCPLGVFQDVVIRIRRIFYRKGFKYSAPWTKTRVTILAISVALFILGFTALPALIEPYSAYGRFVTNLVRPALQLAINALADWCDAHERYWVMSEEIVIASFLSMFVAAGFMVFIAVAAAWRGRWFCNAVCPVGTILAYVYRSSVLEKKFKHYLIDINIDSASCVKCGLCARVCKAECIDVAHGKIDNKRCVRCFNCVGACRKGAIKLW